MSDRSAKNQHIELVATDLFRIRDAALRTQMEYGRWLVSTLVLLHSGALAGLLFKAEALRPDYLVLFWIFLAGILFALSSGFATWLNATWGWEQYDKWGRQVLMRPDSSLEDADRRMQASTSFATVFGLMSAVLLPIGAGVFWYLWMLGRAAQN